MERLRNHPLGQETHLSKAFSDAASIFSPNIALYEACFNVGTTSKVNFLHYLIKARAALEQQALGFLYHLIPVDGKLHLGRVGFEPRFFYSAKVLSLLTKSQGRLRLRP